MFVRDVENYPRKGQYFLKRTVIRSLLSNIMTKYILNGTSYFFSGHNGIKRVYFARNLTTDKMEEISYDFEGVIYRE